MRRGRWLPVLRRYGSPRRLRAALRRGAWGLRRVAITSTAGGGQHWYRSGNWGCHCGVLGAAGGHAVAAFT
jgi:hypothetical protein